jgi:NTE family protein
MGLTLIRKSSGRRPKRNPRIALVLAGGAVSGGAFKVGGLKALNDFFVGRGVDDFDMYVGLSAGAVLAVPLAAGIDPDEMVRVLEGTSDRFDQLRPIDFYYPNVAEFVGRPAKFAYDLASYLPGVAFDLIRGLPTLSESLGEPARRLIKDRTYTAFEALAMSIIEHSSPKRELPALTNHVPSGLFDNKPLERWMRRGLEKIGMPNDFRAFNRNRGRQLFLSACNLDTAERVIFGADENAEVTISQAMQASTALPGFFRPARINGVDYVDGGVRNTANIDVAIEKGADLIVCYNPFRPFYNQAADSDEAGAKYFANGRYLSDRGLKVVMNQVLRTLLHSRLKLAMQRYLADDRFQGDIVLLEPREQEAEFFALNPLAFWKRADAVEHGFSSVRQTIRQNFDQLHDVFAHYGLEMSYEAADRKAAQAQAERGWRSGVEEDDQPSLRLVGA